MFTENPLNMSVFLKQETNPFKRILKFKVFFRSHLISVSNTFKSIWGSKTLFGIFKHFKRCKGLSVHKITVCQLYLDIFLDWKSANLALGTCLKRISIQYTLKIFICGLNMATYCGVVLIRRSPTQSIAGRSARKLRWQLCFAKLFDSFRT